jgi:ribosomal protein S18 acetylase RimI-like enzyme
LDGGRRDYLLNFKTQLGADLALRPVEPADRELLYRVYASTRQEELAPVPWTMEEKETFLRQQYDAQDRYYRQVYFDASYDVILCRGEPAGRIYVYRGDEEIHIIDIALLPPFRERGLGGRLLAALFEEADQADKPVRIHVEHNNRAQRLYARLGFRPISESGVYKHLERRPNPR